MAFKLTTQLVLNGPSNTELDAVLKRIRSKLSTVDVFITPRITSGNLIAIRRVVQSAFKTPVRIPLQLTRSSAAALRTQVDTYLARPFPIVLNVTRRSLSGMWTQIRDYFLGRPVPIQVTTGGITRNTSNNRNNNLGGVAGFGQKLGKSLEHYGTFTAATGGFIQLFGAIKIAIDEAVEFDRELVRVSQVTGTTTSGLADLSNKITEVSTKYGTASNEILKASVTLAQAGLSARDTKQALEALAKTSVSATFGKVGDTTEAAIAIMQQFGKTTADLEGIFSSVNKVSGAFAVESDDITVAVRRAGGAFEAAGGQFEEFLALFTSVRQTTRESAETIATGFRTIFARLQRNRTQNFFKSLGIDLLNDKGLFVGPYESIRKISEALKDVDSADPQFAQIVEELGGFRQVSKVIPLLQQFAVSERAINIARRGGNSLTEDAAKAQESLAIQLKKVHEEFTSLIRDIIGSDVFKGLTGSTLKFTSALIDVVKTLSTLAPLLTTIGVANAAFKVPALAQGFNVAFGGQLDNASNRNRSSRRSYTTNLVENPSVALAAVALQGLAASATGGQTALDDLFQSISSIALQVIAFGFALKTARNIANTQALRNTPIGQLVRSSTSRTRANVANAGIVGGAVASVVGAEINDNATQKINSGKDARYQAAGGNALTYSGIGAGLGSILGPQGAIVGAVSGALYGFTTELFNATETLKSVNVGKEFEELASRIQRVNNGKLSSGSQLQFVKSNIIKQGAAIYGIKDPTKRSDALARFKSDQAQVEVFFGNIAKDSKTFDDFMKQVGSSISIFSALSDIPYKEITDAIKKQIDIQNKENVVQERLNAIYESELQHRVKLVELTAAFNSSFASLSGIDVALNKFQNSLEVGAFGGGTRFNAKDLFEQASNGQFSDSTLLNSIAKNIGTNFGGAANGAVGDVSSVTSIQQRLPELLVRTRSQLALQGNNGDFIDRFLDNLGDVPDFIKRSLKAGLEKIQGNEAKDENIVDKIEQDLLGTVSTLTGGLKPTIDTFGQFAEKIQEHSDKIDKGLSVYEKIQLELIKVDQKRRDVSRDYDDYIASLTGNRPSTGVVVGRRNIDLTSRFGSNSVQSLFNNRNNANAGIGKLDDSINTNFGNIGVVDDLKKQMSDLRIQAEKAGEGLKNIAYDSDGYISVLKNLIDQSRKENEARTKLASTLVFGNREEQRQSGKDIYNSALAARFGIGAVAQPDRRDVESFLEQFGTAKVFGNEQANDLLKRIRVDSLQAQGFSKEKATELVDNIPASVQELLKELNTATAAQDAALKSISDGLTSDSSNLISAIKDGSKNIVDKIAELIQKQQDDKRLIEQSSIDSDRDKLQKQKTGFGIIGSVLGSDDITTAKAVLELSKKRKDDFNKLDNIGIVKDEFLGSGSKDELAKRNKALFKEINPLSSEGRLEKLAEIETKVQKASPNFRFSDDLRASIIDNPYNVGDIRKVISEALFNESNKVKSGLTSNKKEFGQLGITNVDRLIIQSLSDVVPELNALAAAIEAIGDATKSSIKSTEKEINAREARLGRASGGIVPGFGNRDSVPAVLTPGEFVLNKRATRNIGIDTLYAMNATGYASGGFVKPRDNIYNNNGNYTDPRDYPNMNWEEYQAMRLSVRQGQEFKNKGINTPSPTDFVAKDKKTNLGITASIAAFQKRLAIRERNFATQQAIRQKSAEKASSTYKSFGDSQALRDIKATNYNKGAYGTLKTGGPRLSSYGFLDDDGNYVSTSQYADKESMIADKKRREAVKAKFAAGGYAVNKPVNKPVNIAANIPGFRPGDIKTDSRNVGTIFDQNSQFRNPQFKPRQTIQGLPTKANIAGVSNKVNTTTSTGTSVTPNMSGLTDALNRFATNDNIRRLADGLAAFPKEITMQATHKVEVIFNGAEIMTKLLPEIQEIALNQAKQEIGKFANKIGAVEHAPTTDIKGKGGNV